MTVTCYPPESDLLMGKSPCKMLLEFHQALCIFISWTMFNVSSRKPSKFAQTCEQEKPSLRQFLLENDSRNMEKTLREVSSPKGVCQLWWLSCPL